MSEKLLFRCLGAVCLLNAASCERLGSKFDDLSGPHILCMLGGMLWLYLMYRAWREEMAR